MKHPLLRILAAVETSVFLTACASAQNYYTPPASLYNSTGACITAGVTPWLFDVDSSGAMIGQNAKQVAHGDTIIIAPRVLDVNGTPRSWPTNTQFALLYQSGSGMAQSNMWWLDTAPATYPVYGNIGNVDTGRVALAWGATNDFGLGAYSCYLLAYGASGQISQPSRFTMNMLNAPGLNSAVAPQPLYWSQLVSNMVNSAVSQAVSNVTVYALRVTTNGAPFGYYFLQTP